MSEPLFPPSFLWGAATAAYQVEGAVREGGRGPSIWDTFAHTPGKIKDGSDGDAACDHYHRWRDDLELLAGLGLDAYRFSVAWPRVVPDGRGPVNVQGLDFYERLVDGLLARGLKPFCTLYHWDLPQALEDEGGWTRRDTAQRFADYAALVSGRLGDRVFAYATLNEPWCSAHLGYATGEHAPGRRSLEASLRAAHTLLLAHGLALDALRHNAPGAQQGIVLNPAQFYPASEALEDVAAAQRCDALTNGWYLGPLFGGAYPAEAWVGFDEAVPEVRDGDLAIIGGRLDYLGVNYYTPSFVGHEAAGGWPNLRWAERRGVERTAMGWEVYPPGLTDLLLRLHRETGLPLYVTENGAAYQDAVNERGEIDDAPRIRYLERHLAAVAEAMRSGADVRGYFAWSLLDNFEWAEGYAKRFGLVYVDYGSQARTPKRSYGWFQRLVRAQGFDPVG
jgi:beta-glucosidase